MRNPVKGPWPLFRPGLFGFRLFRLHFGRRLFRIHFGLAFALIAVVAIHVAGALQHHLIRRDRTLLRMLPGDPGP